MAEVTIADVMAAYAKDAERHAWGNGIVLDYSESSLERVDEVLWKIAGEGVLTPKTPDEEERLWTLSKMYGGYVGEIVIQNMGGAWEMQENPNGSAQVILRCRGVQMFPLEKVYKRLTEDQFSGVSGYCRVLRLIIERQDAGNAGQGR